MPKALLIPKLCGACQFHYTPPERDTLFPKVALEDEGFCRIDPPENRGGRTVISGMYRVTSKLLPACGRWHKGDQNW
jgi:hypothetical protein